MSSPFHSIHRGLMAILFGGLAATAAWWGWRMFGSARHRSSLPVRLFEPPASGKDEPPSSTLIVFLTSDSGWLGLNTSLPKALARAGFPTVGWNSLRYYLPPRDPAEASQDLERLLDTCARDHPFERWAIVGYSFGAGVLPFLVNRLPSQRKETLSAVAFLAYPGIASFRFRPSGWLLRVSDEDLPATDEVARLPKVPSVCIAGEADPIRDCRSIEGFGIQRRLLPLGHGLQGATDEIVAMVLETLSQGGDAGGNGRSDSGSDPESSQESAASDSPRI